MHLTRYASFVKSLREFIFSSSAEQVFLKESLQKALHRFSTDSLCGTEKPRRLEILCSWLRAKVRLLNLACINKL